MFVSFPDFPDFSNSFRMRPAAVTKLTGPPETQQFVLLAIIPDFPTFSDLFQMRPTATKLFSFLLFVPLMSGFFRISPTFARCIRPPQTCSPSCSSHFRIFPTFSDLFRMRPTATKLFPFLFLSCPDFPVVPTFSDLFQMRPTATKLFSFLLFVPLMSRFYRISPTFAGCIRPPQTCSPSCSFYLPQICCPSCSSHFRIFPDFSDCFRLVPDASDRHKIVSLPVPLISGFSRCSDFFRLVPDASRRHKIDRAPCCLEIETQQFVLLGSSYQVP